MRAQQLGVRPVPPGPGQESVWDYPRPPRLEPAKHRLRVTVGGVTIADTTQGWRVLETSHPPVYYFPRADVQHVVESSQPGSFCEFKGRATYHRIVLQDTVIDPAGWSYDAPSAAFEAITGAIAFYAHEVEAWVDDERAAAQPGGFYGGWVTSHVVGPFKGAPGSWGW